VDWVRESFKLDDDELFCGDDGGLEEDIIMCSAKGSTGGILDLSRLLMNYGREVREYTATVVDLQ